MTEETKLIMEQLQKMNVGLENVNVRLDRVDDRLDKMDVRLDKMDDRLDKMDDRLDKMNARLDKVESDTKETRIIMESDVKRNIMVIAEGHQILNGKLDLALKDAGEREMIKLRLTALESDVRILKRRSGIAQTQA